jgi:putative thioredoxin
MLPQTAQTNADLRNMETGMSDNTYTFEATAESFQDLVITASLERPVLVDFWADWCAPCRSLMPILAGLAAAYDGKFHLVKVNSDEQQDLAQQYAVRSLPTVKIFRNGEVVDEFMGALPEPAVREYIDRHIVRVSDSLRKQARERLAVDDFDGARSLLEEAIATDPEVVENHVDLAAMHAASGKFDDAEDILNALTRTDQERDDVLALRKRMHFDRQAGDAAPAEELQQRIASDPNDLQARSDLAARMLNEERYAEAMEQYLAIMTQDRQFDDDAGRKNLIDVFNLLGNDDPLVSEYRRKMASLLY